MHKEGIGELVGCRLIVQVNFYHVIASGSDGIVESDIVHHVPHLRIRNKAL